MKQILISIILSIFALNNPSICEDNRYLLELNYIIRLPIQIYIGGMKKITYLFLIIILFSTYGWGYTNASASSDIERIYFEAQEIAK